MTAAERVRRRSTLASMVLALVWFAGCEIETTAPAVEPRVVVHAVLNSTSNQQTILVEQTLRSTSVGVNGTVPYDPITDARVVLYGPREDSTVAVGVPARPGAYLVQTITITDGSAGTAPPNVLRLRPGERYRLRVESSLGLVTGETVIPGGGPVDAVRRTFNLDHDTLRLDLTRVRNAAGYVLRHESRINVYERYKTRLDAALLRPLASQDDDEWAFSFAHGTVLPGLPQTFTVIALDSNYLRYYEAGFDPFGDDTRGNTLLGGVGLFGSAAPLMSKTLDLTADIDTPIEGSWVADRASQTLPFTLTLYASPVFPGEQPFDQRISVSGRGRISAGPLLEVFGRTVGNSLSFDLIDPTETGMTSFATGLLSSGTLVLTDRRTGERVTYRKP
jgi:hypothetical protein